jgi:uncharacterized protein with HEPN domain
MKREQRLFLCDILAACQHSQEFVEGIGFDQFQDDERTSSAVIRKPELKGRSASS